MEKISYYCQKCRAANETGEGNCWRCGTRLMLMVFPPSLRHEEGMPPSVFEDHLLERISLLELHLSQVMEQLKMAYEFMRKEAATIEKDHLYLQAFFETIQKVNPDLGLQIETEFSDIHDQKHALNATENKKKQQLEPILKAHGSKQVELFSHLVKEGIALFHDNEEKQAFRTLEKAALLSQTNLPLHLFIAKKLVLAEKLDVAKSYLERAVNVDAQNAEVLLLLGSVYADEVDSKEARKLLSLLVNNPKTTTCVNLIWGMLAAFEGNWSEALAAFKEASALDESTEMRYLKGCVNFQLQRYETALELLQTAVELDESNADAWFMQSVIHNVLGDNANAKGTMDKAFEAKEAGAKCLEFLKKKNRMVLQTALPFRHFHEPNSKLLTIGSPRMRMFFRRQIFESIN